MSPQLVESCASAGDQKSLLGSHHLDQRARPLHIALLPRAIASAQGVQSGLRQVLGSEK